MLRNCYVTRIYRLRQLQLTGSLKFFGEDSLLIGIGERMLEGKKERNEFLQQMSR